MTSLNKSTSVMVRCIIHVIIAFDSVVLRVVAILSCTGAVKAMDLSNVRIVFVDDESANRRLGQRLCKRLGIPLENVLMLEDGRMHRVPFLPADSVSVQPENRSCYPTTPWQALRRPSS